MVLAELKLHRFYQLVVSTHTILVTILSKLHDLIYFGQRENPPCVLEHHRVVFVVVFFCLSFGPTSSLVLFLLCDQVCGDLCVTPAFITSESDRIRNK